MDHFPFLSGKFSSGHLLEPRVAFHMRKVEVIVTMPKFKLEESLGLNDVLQSLGMKQAFSPVRIPSKHFPFNIHNFVAL